MLAGIRDILIISTEQDIPNFKKMFNDGSECGLNISYKVQPSPDGLAQAFLLGEEFIGDDSCAMILGDNIFYGNGIGPKLKKAVSLAENGTATVFGYYMNDPHAFGVVEFDKNNRAISIEEKPENPKSNYIVTGLYFYDKNVVEYAKKVKPSRRGELEITDLNKMYLQDGKLNVEVLGRGYAWMDAGTMDSLYDAASFVKIIEERQGIQIAALEEIAYYNNWIDEEQLKKAIAKHGKSKYGEHLTTVLKNKLKH